jgi:F-type H+-transporting ATPase subunit gamma
VSRRRSLERHRRSLGEIREIMDSMKTLAYLETHKISKVLEAQKAVVRQIEATAADFLASYPEFSPRAGDLKPVFLLVGAERGFCGDFNPALIRALESAGAGEDALLISIGRKLAPLLEKDARVAASFPGAGVCEEIAGVLDRIVAGLTALEAREGPLALAAIHHGVDRGVVVEPLLPPFRDLPAPAFGYPPVLDLTPGELVLALTDQYLFAALNELLNDSLMAENRRRVAHLEGAVRHLDDEAAKLAHRHNALRQEEIVEEIEVILLSAASVARLAESGDGA